MDRTQLDTVIRYLEGAIASAERSAVTLPTLPERWRAAGRAEAFRLCHSVITQTAARSD